MKKTIAVILTLMMLFTVSACSPAVKAPATPVESPNTPTPAPATQTEAPKWADGIYVAIEEGWPSEEGKWKDTALLEVKDGKIVRVDWNGLEQNTGYDKKTAVKNGKYPMVEVGGAKAPWDAQAKLIEDYILEKQDLEGFAYDAEGRSDTVSGVSIHVKGFVDLAKKALEAGPQAPGPYKDGSYHAEADAFDNSWKEFVDLTVINGNIVQVKWNAMNEEDPKLDKLTAVKEGKYPMVANGGAKAEWNVQAQAVEQFLLDNQDITKLTVLSDGKTDAISSVSIHVGSFVQLVMKALGL